MRRCCLSPARWYPGDCDGMTTNTDPRPDRPASGAFDVAAVRSHFPALRAGAAHFDGPGGSQTPDVVARAVHDTLIGPLSNRGRATAAGRNADDTVHAARSALGDLLGADPAGVVFGRSMTQLTFDLARTMAKDWGPGEEVVVTRLDHDANVRPWVIAAERAGATVRWAGFDPVTGELDPAEIGGLLSERTRVVAVTAASNLIGTIPDVRAVADRAHQVGAWLYVDGVHATAHQAVDVSALGADFYACSPYKFLGPHCAAVAARPELLEQLHPDKLLPSPDDVPERFELGTLPYELLAGTTAAIDFLASGLGTAATAAGTRRERLLASLEAIGQHEDRLRRRIETELAQLPGAVVWSRAHHRTPTLLVTFNGHPVREVAAHLAKVGVNAPSGSFYALEASRRLGLGDNGGLRVGLAPYNNDTDVDRLLEGLRAYFSGARDRR
jgi:cysteine desulfurase family protein (TIGR01976 family)